MNPPLVFKTYQDVKNNLMYWTIIILLLSIGAIYKFFLNLLQQKMIMGWINSLGTNSLISTLAGLVLVLICWVISAILIYGIQIHDIVYDRFIVKWRVRYDIEFILQKLTEPIKQYLPKNFNDYAIRYRYKFMNPYYHFVGDGKKGIEENTRVRFYERVTMYWVTQINEIFILLFLLAVPIFSLINKNNPLPTSTQAAFLLVLIVLGLLNRLLVRLTLKATAQATQDEIEEILANPENIDYLKGEYTKLCNDYKI